MKQETLIPVQGTGVGGVSVFYRRRGRKMTGKGRIVGAYPNGSVRIQPDRRGWRQIVISPAELNAGKGETLTHAAGADDATEQELGISAEISNPNEKITMQKQVYKQVLAAAERRGIPQWVPAEKWLPMGPHCVLATDMDTHFIAVWDGTEWSNAWTDEPIDSVVTHWMELPDPPDE